MSAPVVTIDCVKLWYVKPRPGKSWVKGYQYSVNGRIPIDAGPDLGAVRKRIKRHFGPDVEIVESWRDNRIKTLS